MDPLPNEFNHFDYFDNEETHYVDKELQTQVYANVAPL